MLLSSSTRSELSVSLTAPFGNVVTKEDVNHLLHSDQPLDFGQDSYNHAEDLGSPDEHLASSPEFGVSSHLQLVHNNSKRSSTPQHLMAQPKN